MSGSVPRSAARGAAPHGRAAAGSSARSAGKLELEASGALRAPRRAGRRARPASPRVPPPGPATPVTATATSAPSRSRAPAAIAAAASAETAPCSVEHSRRDAELARLTSFAYATIPAEEDVARAGTRRQPRRDEPAGARLGGREREPARHGRAPERSPRPAARPRRTGTARAARQARSSRPASASAPARRRGRRGSRSRGRRRSPPPRPLAAGRPRAPRDGRLAHAVEAESAANRRSLRARARARTGSRLDGVCATAAAARSAGPGKATATHVPVSRTTPGAVPARPRDSAPSGSDACFVTPGAKSP